MNVNNGERLAVSLPGFSGMAGIVEREGFDELCFAARIRALPATAGATAIVAGKARKVISITASPFLPGFVVVQLEKAGA